MERLVHHARATYELGFHMQMLLDHARIESFRKAIARCVRPGSVVVDAGTGSGVLAIIAALSGANRVLALEIAPDVAAVARRNIELCGLSNVIEVVNGDAASIHLRQKVDVVICEMLHSWLVEEMQAPVMRNLVSYMGPDSRIIPEIVENTAALASVEFMQPDLKLFAPFHRWQHEYQPRRLSRAVVVSAERLAELGSLRRQHKLAVQATSTGIANAVALDSRALLADRHWLGQTRTLFPTIYIPLQSTIPVEMGSWQELTIDYELGGRWTEMTACGRQL